MASKFIESFVESALAAELAELTDDGEVVLWGPENNAGVEVVAADTQGPPQTPPDPSPVPRRVTEAALAAPTIRQVWPIEGGEIVFELRSGHALPASAFATLGEVVAKLEALAGSLAAPEVPEPPDQDSES